MEVVSFISISKLNPKTNEILAESEQLSRAKASRLFGFILWSAGCESSSIQAQQNVVYVGFLLMHQAAPTAYCLLLAMAKPSVCN